MRRQPASPVTVRHVTARHAGEVLDIGRPSAEAIQEQVVRMLTDRTFTAGAATLRADHLAAPGPHEVVAGLERRVGLT